MDGYVGKKVVVFYKDLGDIKRKDGIFLKYDDFIHIERPTGIIELISKEAILRVEVIS